MLYFYNETDPSSLSSWVCSSDVDLDELIAFRLNGSHMLELLRGKRLVFVGDSLNRNMWESLVCILRNSVKDRTKVYEASGRHHFRTEASYSFIFEVSSSILHLPFLSSMFSI